MNQPFPGVWKQAKKLYTKNLVPGFSSYKGDLAQLGGGEYREWDPKRSKAAAAIANGLKQFPVARGSKILYLGIASGTTASHFSDIIGPEGVIYGVEISERSMRDLNPVAEARKNIVPILADARMPQGYSWVERCDVVFQDVATNDQSEILIRNCKEFLKPKGFAMLSLKSRSIDVTKQPEQVYREEEAKLKKAFKVLEKIRLDPWEKDHMLFLLQKA